MIAEFYAVGLILFFVPFSRNLFFLITPLTLAGALALVLLYHPRWNGKTIAVFAAIVLLSFFTEMVGVHTGKPFGEYAYRTTLGPKLAGTPLIIGCNWLLLIYGTHTLASRLFRNSFLIVLGGSACMVLNDLVLELSAPHLKMWQFEESFPPLENFISWFALSAFFHFLLIVFRVDTKNPAAQIVVIIQFLFFVILTTYFLIFTP